MLVKNKLWNSLLDFFPHNDRSAKRTQAEASDHPLVLVRTLGSGGCASHYAISFMQFSGWTEKKKGYFWLKSWEVSDNLPTHQVLEPPPPTRSTILDPPRQIW